jgi:Protein of unknown function (DUF3102)
MRKAKKTKGPRRKATALDRIAARLRTALRRETKNIIEIGKILIESRDKHLEHGKWQTWLAENFDLPYRTAIRYVNAAGYVARKGKSATVALGNLSPTVLYRLAEGRFYDEQDEAAILAASRERRVDEGAADAICEALAPPADDPPAPPADDAPDDAGDEDGSGEDGDAAAEDPESAAILDGPPPPVPPPAPIPPPTDFALRNFDEAIGKLKRLMTKPSAQFAGTVHSANELVTVEDFIRSVREHTGAPR